MESVFVDSTATKNISYLCARDPSILALGPLMSPENLFLDLSSLTEKVTKDEPEDRTHLHVYLRMKKTDSYSKELYEITNETTLLYKLPPFAYSNKNISNSVTKKFRFSKIFGPDATQVDIFNDVVKAKVLHFINGYNCSLLTYGGSGSGKTYTIVGTMNEPGILPRSLEYLFRTLPELPELPQFKPDPMRDVMRLSERAKKNERLITRNLLDNNAFINESNAHVRAYRTMQKRLSEEPVAKIINDITEDVSLSVWVSFAEIYNENIYDLLISELSRGKPRQRLHLGQCQDNAYIKDLTYINVRSGLEAYQILLYGLHNLRCAATSVNDHSSRSHSIFTILFIQASDTKEGYGISAFNFCDLAGSERIKNTNNVGERLNESKNINKSLMVLGRCLNVIRQCQKENSVNRPIPFRDSKLTRIFQKALLGHELIFMMVNINTTKNMFDETHHILNFSAIAKDVNIVEQQLVQPLPRSNRFSGYMQQQLNVINPVVEKEKQDGSDALILQIRELEFQLQKQKLEAKEDREYILGNYSNMLKDANEFWENRYKTLEERIRQSNRALMHASKKEAHSSVICLDSSSSSDEDEMNSSFRKSRNEVAKLTQQLHEKEESVRILTKENAELKQTLDDGIKMYKELEVQSESTIKEIKVQLVVQEEQISLFQNQIDCYSMFGSLTDDFVGGHLLH